MKTSQDLTNLTNEVKTSHDLSDVHDLLIFN